MSNNELVTPLQITQLNNASIKMVVETDIQTFQSIHSIYTPQFFSLPMLINVGSGRVGCEGIAPISFF